MCQTLVNSKSTSGTLMRAVAGLATDYGVSYEDYDAVTLSKTAIDINKSGR